MTSHPGKAHSSSVKTYLAVFAGLAVLTGLTVLLSYAGLSHGTGVALAALISLGKCLLIALFFMHLKSEGKGILFWLILAFFFVAIFLLAVVPDIALHF